MKQLDKKLDKIRIDNGFIFHLGQAPLLSTSIDTNKIDKLGGSLQSKLKDEGEEEEEEREKRRKMGKKKMPRKKDGEQEKSKRAGQKKKGKRTKL
jgi:hypothetical protein